MLISVFPCLPGCTDIVCQTPQNRRRSSPTMARLVSSRYTACLRVSSTNFQRQISVNLNCYYAGKRIDFRKTYLHIWPRQQERGDRGFTSPKQLVEYQRRGRGVRKISIGGEQSVIAFALRQIGIVEGAHVEFKADSAAPAADSMGDGRRRAICQQY